MQKLKKQSLILLISCLTICPISILFFDQKVAQYFSHEDRLRFWLFNRSITDLGEAAIYIIITLIMYIGSRWVLQPLKLQFPRPEFVGQLRQWSGYILLNFIVVGLIIHILKFLFGRQRPHITELHEALVFEPFNFHWHHHSFPSGHAQVSIMLATLASLKWPRFQILYFLLGGYLAFTRIATYQHFVSDVVLGGTIGYLGTLWFYQYYFRIKKD